MTDKKPVKNFKIPSKIWKNKEVLESKEHLGGYAVPFILSVWILLSETKGWRLTVNNELLGRIVEDTKIPYAEVKKMMNFFYQRQRKFRILSFSKADDKIYLWSRVLEEELLSEIKYHRKYSKVRHDVSRSRNNS